jgi:hypothetical protein
LFFAQTQAAFSAELTSKLHDQKHRSDDGKKSSYDAKSRRTNACAMHQGIFMTNCFRLLFSLIARCQNAWPTSPRLLAATLFTCSFFASAAHAQTIIEYYNEALDAHFLTGRATEQAALDATASFMRTGMSFSAASALAAPAGTVSICRFYIAVDNPFTRSHFYGVNGLDCERLVAAPPAGFSFESASHQLVAQFSVGGNNRAMTGARPYC